MSTTKKTSSSQVRKPAEFYNGRPPSTLRIVPYRPVRSQTAWDPESNNNVHNDAKKNSKVNNKKVKNFDVDDDDEPPQLDGKSKSLLKRLNKSGNSIFSKKWTQDRNKARQAVEISRIDPIIA